MSLVVLLGGARSGKSRLAVELAAASAGAVVVVATAEALDAEMAERIDAHRRERATGWTTIEEPLDLEGALSAVATGATCVLDCLSLWVSNLLMRGDEAEAIEAASRACATTAAAREGTTIAVTNEVGLGIVPATPLGRRYRDVLGSVNRAWVESAERAAFVVAGRVVPLEATATLLDA